MLASHEVQEVPPEVGLNRTRGAEGRVQKIGVFKSEHHDAGLCFLATIRCDHGLRVGLGISEGFWMFLIWNQFPREDPASTHDAPRVVGLLDLLVIQALANCFIFEEATDFLGLGTVKQLAELWCELLEVDFAAPHLLDEEQVRIANEVLPFAVTGKLQVELHHHHLLGVHESCVKVVSSCKD